MGRLNDQVVYLTGGGSGLGLAIVERFLNEGALLVVLEKYQAKADALIERFDPSRVQVVVGDATSFADNMRAVNVALESFGRLDCFIGNVGIWDFDRGLDSLAGNDIGAGFDELFSVNVKSAIVGARAAVSALRQTNGSMVFTLSNASFYPGGGGVLYTASKHAMVGMIRQLAYELAPEVRVNGVAPGGMTTDLRGPASLALEDVPYSASPVDEIMKRWSPLEISPPPADYVPHYILLASREESRVVTGCIHSCDTGAGIWGRKQMQSLELDFQFDRTPLSQK